MVENRVPKERSHPPLALGRWGRCLAIGVLVLGIPAGCGVSTNGITGIAADSSGELVVTLAWCGRQPDVLTIYHDDPSRTDDPNVKDARFRAPKLKGNSTAVNLERPSNGWRPETSIPSLDQAVLYYAVGGTKDNSKATRHVAFHSTVAATLKPGQVFFQDAENSFKDTVVSESEFTKRASKLC
jgi:hypothetical protein